MTVLGINSSPIRNGNVDRMVQFILENSGKPFFVVSSGGLRSPEGAVKAVKRRMTAYRAHFSSSIAYTSTNIPCFKCGYGTVCEVGSSQKVYGEEGRKNLKITKDLFNLHFA